MERINKFLAKKSKKERSGGMIKIDNFISANAKYSRLARPLEAAHVCDTARGLADGRFEVVSFREGLITLGVHSSSEATNLRFISENIVRQINEKLGQEKVEKARIKIVD